MKNQLSKVSYLFVIIVLFLFGLTACSDKEPSTKGEQVVSSSVNKVSPEDLVAQERLSLGTTRSTLVGLLSNKFGQPFCDLSSFQRIPTPEAEKIVRDAFSHYEDKGPLYKDIVRLFKEHQDAAVLYAKFPVPTQAGFTELASYPSEKVALEQEYMYIPAPKGFKGLGVDSKDPGYALDLSQIRRYSLDNPNCHYVRCCSGDDGPCCHYCFCMEAQCGISCPSGQPSTCKWNPACKCEDKNRFCPNLPPSYWKEKLPVTSIEIGHSL